MTRLLITIGLLASMSLPCAAGPNPDELKSFKVLVPDYSKTCGGLSPAIAPNGEDLAFYSHVHENYRVGDLYTMSGLSLIDENTTVNPKKMEYKPGFDTGWACPDTQGTREIDWSPDGDWLAFVGRDWSLYVVHMFDPVNKSTDREVRQIASSDSTSIVRVPRWSPDGKRIAYIRWTGSGPNAVCVVDVASGKETVLANDATDVENVWQQPWSADSKRIVYAGGKPQVALGMGWGNSPLPVDAADKGGQGFITVVALEGDERRCIRDKGNDVCPSWSPKGDRIAMICPVTGSYKLAEERYIGYSTMTVWVSDTNGNNRKVLTSSAVPWKKTAAEFEAIFAKAAARGFEKQYAPKLTLRQLKKVRTGKMTIMAMALIAGSIIAKETGVKISSFEFGIGKDNDGSNKNSKRKEIAAKAMAFIQEAFQEVIPAMLPKIPRLELSPVWSPDGKSIAFTRGLPGDEGCDNQLVVQDLTTGRERVLIDHSGVGSVSWTKSGKLLVVQARRLMSRKGNGLEINSQTGYPEIWLLEPK